MYSRIQETCELQLELELLLQLKLKFVNLYLNGSVERQRLVKV